MNALYWSFLMVPLVGIIILGSVPVVLMVERRGSAWMQRRSGPNRVGPWGLMQPMADALKLVFKEENIPSAAHKPLFILAPALAVLPPFLAFAVIPLSGSIHLGGQDYPLQVSNLSVGLLFLLAITSLHVYSVLAAGWSSNNKFSLMGALRSSSQMISYEIAIGITIVSMVMTYGTLDLRQIVKLQEAGSSLPFWGILMQPLGFLLIWISSFAETNRLPFDLPEGESELVAGYHTEYSGLKFALFFLAEYASMFLASAFMTTLFLGGYNVPFISEAGLREFFVGHGLTLEMAALATVAIQFVSFLAKMWLFMWIFVWVRWTLPRFRYDQLMDLGWKIMLPLGVLNVMVTMLVTFFMRRGA
ncbi:MAG: NADH-quinone oxidoreductase subunit NuoH [Bdellovibrionales bacterium]|nr:NADH-quinone oxidoreductase subunit NuoH [Bdellovibrionales bacterium]